MSIFGKLFSNLSNDDKHMANPHEWRERKEGDDIDRSIPYGSQRRDGGHDHRTNRGGDRTPAQRDADKRRRK